MYTMIGLPTNGYGFYQCFWQWLHIGFCKVNHGRWQHLHDVGENVRICCLTERKAYDKIVTSGTPPTLVETTNKPQDAAEYWCGVRSDGRTAHACIPSNNAMQKDSVREQFKNMCPRTSTSRTLWWGTAPTFEFRFIHTQYKNDNISTSY